MSRSHGNDIRLLFAARALRMFAYGMLAVVLALYLERLGLSKAGMGLLFSMTLFGDTLMSLVLTTRADRLGRRLTLVIGSVLMTAASVVFASTSWFWPLVVAATFGVLSPSGNEVGPFLPVEQAALSEELPSDRRVGVIAWYNLTGYFATALGAMAGGAGAQALQQSGWTELASFKAVVVAHGCLGVVMAILYSRLSPQAETRVTKSSARRWLGLHKSKRVVVTLASLFSVDAFAGGFVMQSLIAYWFHLRYGASESQLGTILFFGNLFAGVSALLAVRIAKRFGLLNTMVWTHIPSNVLLMLVPLAPRFELAAGLLLVRFCLSQMDVPTRQAYVMSVVDPDERSAAGGVTNVARSIGASLAPLLTGLTFAVPAAGVPFLVAGGLKIAYDLALWRLASRSGFAEVQVQGT